MLDRAEQMLVRREGEGFAIRRRALRTLDRAERPLFERNWPN